MSKWLWTGMAFLAMAVWSSSAVCAQQTVKADRTPLTYRDSGLYCNLQFWHCHEPHEDGVTNLLPPERAAGPESPWAFYVMQTYLHRVIPGELIREMAANGKKVILVTHLPKNTAPAPPVEEMWQGLLEQMSEIKPDWLYAITLAEERCFWGGWTEALTELYHRCKQQWPDLPVYQWWTPMEVPNVRTTSGWVALPADGWVIDLYGRPRVEFEKKLIQTLETGKPVIHIVWSSPDWPCAGCMGAPSWEEGGRQIFEDQLEVCRSYNVPVAHFCTQEAGRREGRTTEEIRWGWHAVNPVVRDWYRYIEVRAENTRRLPDAAIGFRTLDKSVFDWAHSSDQPRGLSYDLDERQRKQVTLQVDLGQIALEPGEHPVSLGEGDRYFRLTCILDESAAELAPGMSVAGAAARSVGATLTFRLEPVRPVSALAVAARMYAHPALSGLAQLSTSADGQDWSEPLRSDPESQQHTLTGRRPLGFWVAESRFSDDPLWIRVHLGANAGVETNTAAILGGLEISAAVAPALN